MLLFKWFYMFIERETQNYVLKFREFFPWRETVLGAHGVKSDEKPFFCQIFKFIGFLGKMVHVVIDRYFSLFLKGLKIFLNRRLSLIVPLTHQFIWKAHSLCEMLMVNLPREVCGKCMWLIVHCASLTCSSMWPQHTSQSTYNQF